MSSVLLAWYDEALLAAAGDHKGALRILRARTGFDRQTLERQLKRSRSGERDHPQRRDTE